MNRLLAWAEVVLAIGLFAVLLFEYRRTGAGEDPMTVASDRIFPPLPAVSNGYLPERSQASEAIALALLGRDCCGLPVC
jgi:hypothetical protein